MPSFRRVKKRHDEDHLCAWIDPEHPTPVYRINDAQTRANQNLSDNNNIRKSNSYTNTRLKPAAKRWNRLLRNHSREKLDDYVFKHFTDCGRYMVEYREEKVKKLKGNASDENPYIYSPSPSYNVDVNDVIYDRRHVLTLQSPKEGEGRHVLTLQAPKEGEGVTLSYRVEGGVKSKANHRDSYGVPMRVNGGRCLDCQSYVNNNNKNDVTSKRYVVKSNICALPKCEPFYIPSKTPPTKRQEKSLNPEHFLQGKKFSELSLSNSLHTKPIGQRAWRPQPIRTREKVRSAQERKRNESTSPASCNNYTNIIKRVLEHYDPSNNTVRNPVNKANDLKSSFVLAST